MPSDRTQVVATQSNYIPWKGYFDQVRRADRFILLDCVQFTRRDWRNRNRIKTPQGLSWLTIPVVVKGRYHQAIDETLISASDWAEKHLRVIEANYARAAAFEKEFPWLAERFREAAAFERLSDVNRHLLDAICERIGISTALEPCETVLPRDDLIAMAPSDRLLALCRAAGATHYLSGPAARDYLDTALFTDAGIEVVWMDYTGYPSYPQVWCDFEHGVSIIDLLLNVGAEGALACLDRTAARLGRDGLGTDT